MQEAIRKLTRFGPFPPSEEAEYAIISKQHELLQHIASPLTDDEARELVKLFGPDEYFGGAWTILHLIETAPHWPLADCLVNESNEWVSRLIRRARNVDRGAFNATDDGD